MKLDFVYLITDIKLFRIEVIFMKFTEEIYKTISDLLEEEYNNCDDEDRKKELKDAMDAIDAIGTY